MNKDHLMQAHLLTGLTTQQVIWAAMHQCYSARYVWEEIQDGELPDDEAAGRSVVANLLKGDRGHYGPIEEMGITVACGYVPHSVMQQLRTHRIAVTFDCQSMRYTSQSIIDAASDEDWEPTGPLESAFYLRPVGEYRDRNGKRYIYTGVHRGMDIEDCHRAAEKYRHRVVDLGFSEEHARGLLPFDYRQHFMVSFNNIRSLWHMLDLRWRKDAQLEAQWLMDSIAEATAPIAPAMWEWYCDTRAKRGKLAP